MKKALKWVGIVLLVLVVVIQLVPYGRDHDNPPVVQAAQWDSPRTEELFNRACADCHSNRTVWPGYSNVAPISWLVYHDVEEGREHFNVDEMNREQRHAGEAAEEVEHGEMPLPIYLPMHPEAKLTDAEKAELITGLKATFGEEHHEKPGEGGGEAHEHEEGEDHAH